MPDTPVWDPNAYDTRHRYVAEYGAPLIDLLAPQPGERILDVGCGTGYLTNEIASRGATVIGIDSSAEMIAEARKQYPTIVFEVGDATQYAPDTLYDAVFSNAALHWMKPPETVVRMLARALKAEGRLVAEFGGKGNVGSLTAATGVNPWYYPSIAEYASLLEQHGISVISAVLFDRPTRIEGESGLRDWIKMFYKDLVSPDRIPAIEEQLRPKLFRHDAWFIDYKRLRLIAIRDAS